jgi:hypothetical protein
MNFCMCPLRRPRIKVVLLQRRTKEDDRDVRSFS